MSATIGRLPQDEAGRGHGTHPAHRGSIHLEEGTVIAFSDELATLEVDGPESGALVELPHEAEIKRL